MSRICLSLLLLFAALASGCSGYMVRQMPVNPVSRVYKAGFEDTWNAALDSLAGMPLASVDRASGVIVTDWLKGFSDHRYFGTPERVERWQQVRYKMTVRIAPAREGAWVGVDLYEETNYPRKHYTRTSWSRGPYGMRSGHFSHSFDVERLDSFEVDDWVSTPSSTAREKDLLDKIEYTLLARG